MSRPGDLLPQVRTTRRKSKVGILYPPQGGLNYWIGCVASDSSDLDAALPTRDGEHPRLVVPFSRASSRPCRCRCYSP
jgi:hypothetical protein